MSEGANYTQQQTPFTDHLRVHSAATATVEAVREARKVRWTKQDLAIEKLAQSNKDHYIEVARIFKNMEEKKECTFHPKVNQEGKRYEDVQDLFERLHEDRARRLHN
jgi:hypothetical protein